MFFVEGTKTMGIDKTTAGEDLAIQNTLSLTVEERLELLANLIVDKIIEDEQQGGATYEKVLEWERG